MRCSLLLLLALCPAVYGQSTVELGGMQWTCTQADDYLIMELQAPTTGWVGVGFNQTNSIVHSDLLLLNIVEDEVNNQDMYVVDFGNPRLDTDLSGSHDLEVLAFEERNGQTYIRFRRPLMSTDHFDFDLEDGAKFWLILAYSTHDDFAHHSRMRQHTQVVLDLK